MRALLLFTLLLCGCGADRGVSTYLRQLQPFQASLADFKNEMAGVQARALAERPAAFLELASRVRARGAEMEQLKPPAAMAGLHGDTRELFTVFGDYLEQASKAGGPDDPKLKELAARWQETAARAQSRLK